MGRGSRREPDSSAEEERERPSVEGLFQRLPALDSAEFIEYVRTADPEVVPAEVLVRAFRQLPPESEGARATLDRLCRRLGKRWEYFDVLGNLAARRAEKMLRQHRGGVSDVYEDLLQDAMTRILAVLHTDRGARAERGWATFCYTEFSDAWRNRYGRKGQKLGPRRAEPQRTDEADETEDPLNLVVNEQALWQVVRAHDQTARVEAIATGVASKITDEFVREVARASWFENERPKTSGSQRDAENPPLQRRFPGRSRDQLNRALRKADSLLAAALLEDRELDWSDDVRTMLEKQRNRGHRR